VTVSPNGSFLYVANGGSNNVSAFTINSSTGVLAAVAGSPFSAGTTPSGIATPGRP
jgi:6-phosphogluconolactonase (cycloisomerase 2 family)